MQKIILVLIIIFSLSAIAEIESEIEVTVTNVNRSQAKNIAIEEAINKAYNDLINEKKITPVAPNISPNSLVQNISILNEKFDENKNYKAKIKIIFQDEKTQETLTNPSSSVIQINNATLNDYIGLKNLLQNKYLIILDQIDNNNFIFIVKNTEQNELLQYLKENNVIFSLEQNRIIIGTK